MKYIFSYFLVGLCCIGFSITAGDYSEYTSKDAQSFVQEINKDTRLSVVLSDCPTTHLSRDVLSQIYPEYRSYFSSEYSIKRLIPFHVINEKVEGPTILPNIYVPYIFLLEKRFTDLILQIKENGWSAQRLESDIVLNLINKIKSMKWTLSAIAQKVELEEVIKHHARKIAMPSFINQIRSQDCERIHQIYKSHLESQLERAGRKHQQEVNDMRLKHDHMTQVLKRECDHEIAILQLERQQVRNTKKTLDLLSKNFCDQQLRMQEQVSFLILQRNILFCLIPFFIAITGLWCINNKTTIT